MKKLLKIALTILMVMTIGVVNVSAEEINFDKYTIVYHGVGATNVNGGNQAQQVNGEWIYIQQDDFTTEGSSVVGFKPSENHFVKGDLTFVGWSKTPESRTAEIGTDLLGKNVKLSDYGLSFGLESKCIDLYAVWSPRLEIVYHNIDGSSPAQDENPNVLDVGSQNTVTVFYKNVKNGFDIIDARKKSGATDLRDQFGGWYYDADLNNNTNLWTKLQNKVDTTLFDALTANGTKNATLDLYAKWYYTIDYDFGAEGSSLISGWTEYTNYVEKTTKGVKINYQRSGSNYTPVYDSSYVQSSYYYPSLGSNLSAYNNKLQFNFADVGTLGGYYHFKNWTYMDYKYYPNGTQYNLKGEEHGDDRTIVTTHADGEKQTKPFVFEYKATWEKYEKVNYYNTDKEILSTDDNPDYVLKSQLEVTLDQNISSIDGAYYFKDNTHGWSDNAEFNNSVTVIDSVDKNYYQKWLYDVVFDANGGTFPTGTYDNGTSGRESLTSGRSRLTKMGYVYTVSEPLSVSHLPTRNGYTFKGWVDVNGTFYEAGKSVVDLPYYECETSHVHSSSCDHAKHLLKAVWEANTYKIVLNANDPLHPCNVSHTHTAKCTKDSKYVVLPEAHKDGANDSYFVTKTFGTDFALANIQNPTRYGYNFVGWSTSSTGTKLSGNLTDGTFNVTAPAANGSTTVNLYAIWSPKTYTIKFNVNNPTGTVATDSTMADQTYVGTSTSLNYSDDVIVRAFNSDFAVTGYKFDGWTYEPVKTTTPNNAVTYYNGNYKIEAYKSGDSNEITLYAQWTPIHYDVDFHTGKGTMSYGPTTTDFKYITTREGSVDNGNLVYKTANDGLTYDVNYTLPQPSRTGYTFVGWYSTSDYIETPQNNTKVTSIKNLTATDGEHVDLYAKFVKNDFTIVLEMNNGDGSTNAIIKDSFRTSHNLSEVDVDTYKYAAKYDESYILPASNNISRTGYVFKGWATTVSGEDGSGNSTIKLNSKTTEFDAKNATSTNNSEITYYAIWEPVKYDIEFNLNDPYTTDSATPSFSVRGSLDQTGNKKTDAEYDVTYTLPVASYTGYVFEGWYTASTDGTKIEETKLVNLVNSYNGSNKITYTLYAHWTPVTYSIVFDSNKPTSIDNISVSGEVTGLMTSQDVVFNVDYNGASTGLFKLKKNTYELAGYTFKGWNTQANGGGTNFTDEQAIISNLLTTSGEYKLYAQWARNKYTIEFVKNKGEGSTYPYITNTLTNNLPVGNKTSVTDSYRDVIAYSAMYDIEYTMPVINREGYVFDGWFTSLNGGTRVDNVTDFKLLNLKNGNKDNSDEKYTLYAHWTPITYDVVFNLNKPTATAGSIVVLNNDKLSGYTVADNKYTGVKYDSEITTPDLSLVGYIFGGWAETTSTTTVKYAGDVKISNIFNGGYTTSSGSTQGTYSKTYVAIWTPITYTIEFDFNNAPGSSAAKYLPTVLGTGNKLAGLNVKSGTNSSVYTYASTYDVSYLVPVSNSTTKDFDRVGYTFAGWFTQPVGGVQLTPDTDGKIKNVTNTQNNIVTFYAHWNAKTTTINLNHVLDSTKNTTKSVVFDEFKPSVAVPTANGYEFLGYFDIPQSSYYNATATVKYADKHQYFDAQGAYVQCIDTEKTTGTPVVWNHDYKWVEDIATKDLYAWWSYTLEIDANGGVISYKTTSSSTSKVAENQIIQFTNINTNVGDRTLGFTNLGTTNADNYAYIGSESSTATAISNLVVNGVDNAKYLKLEKVGYTLIGFDSNPAATTPTYGVNGNLNVNTDTAKNFSGRLYAIWEENTYKVIFHNTSVSPEVTVEQTFKYTDEKVLTSNSFEYGGTDKDKAFIGWTTDSSAVATAGTFYVENQSVSKLTSHYQGQVDLYAVWSDAYVVVYKNTNDSVGDCDANVNWNFDGSSYQIKEASKHNINSLDGVNITNTNPLLVDQKDTNVLLSDSGMKRTGYDFVNFYKDAEGKQSITNINQAVVNDGVITVYMKWTPKANAKDYQVKFNVNADGDTTASLNLTGYANLVADTNDTVKFNYDKAQSIPNPTRRGYTFLGWTTDAVGTTFASDTAYATTTTGKTFESVKTTDAVKVLASDTTTVRNPLYTTTGDKVLYAKWLANDYKITYDVNIPVGSIDNNATTNHITNTIDVNMTSDVTFADGAKVEYPDTDKTPELNGYTFKGWSTSKDSTTTLAANALVDSLYVETAYNTAKNTYDVAQGVVHTNPYNITVYAVWTPKKFNVVFDDNNPVKPDDQTKWDGKVVMSNGSNYVDKTVEKTFDVDIATSDIPVVTRQGYTFDGWMLSDGTVVQSFDDITLTRANYSLDNLELRAKWIANEGFTVTFDKNDDWTDKEYRVLGEMADVEDIVYNAEMTLPACNFTMKGYTFMGWSITKNGPVNFANGDKYVIQNIDANANEGGKTLTLYAVWQANVYYVKFNNGTTDKDVIKATGTMNTITVKFDENKTLTEMSFTRPGYKFLRWETKDEKSEIKEFVDKAQIKNLTSIAGSTIELKAIWEPLNVAVVDGVFANGTDVWVDGQKTKVVGGTISLDAGAKVVTTYKFSDDNTYPTGMEVYRVENIGDGNKTLVKMAHMTDLLTYGGTSIRLTGNKGIRIMTELRKEDKLALTGTTGIDNYIAVEYGTVMAWQSNLGGLEPTLGFADIGKAAKGYAYNRAAGYDKVFQWSNAAGQEVSQADAIKAVYTNVLTGNWTKEQCAQNFSMRPYVILRPVNAVDTTQDIVVYGGTVVRSIKSVANQAIQLKYEYQGVKYWYYGTNGSEYSYFVNSLGGTPRSADEASRPQN